MSNPLTNPVLVVSKKERGRAYADLAVQGTNNSSIASKRSVEALYLPRLVHGTNKEYFKYFVPKAIKRSPCINRGYWLRLHAIRSRLNVIRSEFPNNKLLIVNLGCGFDPLPFEFLDYGNHNTSPFHEKTHFLDIDYSHLLRNKVEIISKTPELLNIIGPNESSLTDCYTSSKYCAVPCDLNNSASYEQLLATQPLLQNTDVIKVFIAEVSLAYMTAQKADQIISMSSRVEKSHFLLMEQIIPQGPSDPFAKQMLKHFKKNDSPLQTVNKYQTVDLQLERFKRNGFPNVDACDLLSLWDAVESKLKEEIETIQPFDELEEFQLFAHHYLLLHGCNHASVSQISTTPYDVGEQNLAAAKGFVISPYGQLKMSFGSAVITSDKRVLYFGGSTPARVNHILEMTVQDLDSFVTKRQKPNDLPDARTCHTWTKLGNGKVLLVGGRNAPHRPYNDIWIYDTEHNLWEQKTSLPYPRFRHCTAQVDENCVLIYGGSSTLSVTPFNICDVKNGTVTVPEGSAVLKCLASSAMDRHPALNEYVILGGYDKESVSVSDELVVIELATDHVIRVLRRFKNPLFQRYGSKMKFIDNKRVVIVGGSSPSSVFNTHNTIVLVDVETGQIKSIPIPDHIWQDHQLLFVGFELEFLPESRELIVIGGGATCYGFGQVYNTTLRIELPALDAL
ncbi:tRNA methyltransferase PPM2 KNAG_0A01180 [Huiozyma naganishii CBS 8797]|uniref:tRNA wybutosine-synthesizing protein 4 n=1 Tax=Huiozyma naganishii (strain ATCC MYA-139 / BCRC 22969 / CBS 8797 / KCTC 17520 / NBRC 10181 / NCYC 3082 / Yp74L-3) TaxID=1071383 RepID=J7RSZ5_HUIN7|nr:hypothetical protein KNAG_0A01180 [Kazachstania naganishii CBS 8797]CCK67807.1 hypothetical protein KNAG_0A01180 [Kazachstania naganishii CBS 8797]